MPNNHKSTVPIYLYHTVISPHHVIPTTLTSFYSRHHVSLLCDPCNRMKSNKMTLTQLRQACASEGRMDEDWYEEEKRK